MILFGSPYTIREGVVFWATHPVPKADAASFRHLGGHWARDAERIFANGKIKKVDVSSFKYLNTVFAKDANAAYDIEGPIKGAAPESFQVLDSKKKRCQEPYSWFAVKRLRSPRVCPA